MSAITDVLEPLGGISSRPMFGGAGIYQRGQVFALVDSEGTLYFRVDDASRPRYVEAGSVAFFTEKYYSAPAVLYDDEELMLEWAVEAIEASRRAPTPRRKGRKRR